MLVLELYLLERELLVPYLLELYWLEQQLYWLEQSVLVPYLLELYIRTLVAIIRISDWRLSAIVQNRWLFYAIMYDYIY